MNQPKTEGWSPFTPILQVSDADASIRFYCDSLGFTLDWVHRFEEDFPAYACVHLGPLIAHLSEHHGGGINAADLFVLVPDVDAVYADFQARGLTADPPASAPEIGLRSFEFHDPDGHRLEFATGIASD